MSANNDEDWDASSIKEYGWYVARKGLYSGVADHADTSLQLDLV